MFGLKKRLQGNLISLYSILLLLFFSIRLLQTDRTIFAEANVGLHMGRTKLINENLYDNVYLASYGIIFITEHPLVGSLRGSSLLLSRF